jgi:hypothetical protein
MWTSIRSRVRGGSDWRREVDAPTQVSVNGESEDVYATLVTPRLSPAPTHVRPDSPPQTIRCSI